MAPELTNRYQQRRHLGTWMKIKGRNLREIGWQGGKTGEGAVQTDGPAELTGSIPQTEISPDPLKLVKKKNQWNEFNFFFFQNIF